MVSFPNDRCVIVFSLTSDKNLLIENVDLKKTEFQFFVKDKGKFRASYLIAQGIAAMPSARRLGVGEKQIRRQFESGFIMLGNGENKEKRWHTGENQSSQVDIILIREGREIPGPEAGAGMPEDIPCVKGC